LDLGDEKARTREGKTAISLGPSHEKRIVQFEIGSRVEKDKSKKSPDGDEIMIERCHGSRENEMRWDIAEKRRSSQYCLKFSLNAP
jgi:hypothetical protein